MPAYYNEREGYAAAWLRNLIAAGHIAPGEVDTRSITEVSADDLRGFTQCHFFAGIGVWSHALRRAGWADDVPVWTGSCPCQPFSAAGKQKGFDDERHLWPVWFDLIRQCRPSVVVGEQVASALDWLDLVSADMEGEGYAFGAADLCAAGFGGAHIRQRLYFVAVEGVADALRDGAGNGPGEGVEAEAAPDGIDGRVPGQGIRAGIGSATGRLADAHDARLEGRAGVPERADECAAGTGSVAGRLADAECYERGQVCALAGGRGEGSGAQGLDERSGDGGDERGWMADATSERQHGLQGATGARGWDGAQDGCGDGWTDPPLLGRDAADWLWCRDGKWRPVEPGTFPLVDAAPARVGRLRAYGNALDAETAAQFCGAVMDLTWSQAA